MFKYFQQAYLEPLLTIQEYNELDNNFKQFFEPTFLKHYPCKLCTDKCSPEIIAEDGELYFSCDSGFISLPQKIKENDITRYKLKLKKVFSNLAEQNNIKPDIKNISDNCIYIGIDDNQRKYFYLSDLSQKNLAQRIYSIKEFFVDSSINILITAKELHLREMEKSFLKENHCQLAEMEHIIQSGFHIEKHKSQNPLIEIDANKRMINLFGIEIYFGRKLKLFKFLYELALKPQQKVSAEVLSGNKKSGNYDKTPAESARKSKERLIKLLTEELIKNKKDVSLIDCIITQFNQDGSYCLNLSQEQVSIIGTFDF